MTVLSHSSAGGNESWKQQGDHFNWYRALEEFLSSVPFVRSGTLEDLRKCLRENLRREPNEERVGRIIMAYAGLKLLLDEKILAVSSSVHELEFYLKWETMFPIGSVS